MGELDNAVAVITGAARGQGRSHAVALAEHGADIIAVDICADIDAIPYPLATKSDLDTTAQLVQDAGRKVVPVVADVRDLAALEAGVQAGIDDLGDIDIVIANAGVVAIGDPETRAEPVFTTIVDTNLKGCVAHACWRRCRRSSARDGGGSVVLVSSSQGLIGRGGDGSAAMFAYAASKHGVVGLMRSAANAYAPHKIRVNSVNPSGVATPMIINDFVINRMLENPEPGRLADAAARRTVGRAARRHRGRAVAGQPAGPLRDGHSRAGRRRPRRHVAASQPTSTA